MEITRISLSCGILAGYPIGVGNPVAVVGGSIDAALTAMGVA